MYYPPQLWSDEQQRKFVTRNIRPICWYCDKINAIYTVSGVIDNRQEANEWLAEREAIINESNK